MTDPIEEATRAAMASDLPLVERLGMVAQRVRDAAPAFAAAVDRFVVRLTSAEAGAAAPQVGEKLPRFVLPDEAGKLVSLDALLAQGPLVLAFLRGHWCPYCRITASALAQMMDAARAQGARVVAITPERRRFSARLDGASDGLPILADIDNGYALALNLAVWVDEEMSGLIAGSGFDVPSYQGNASWMVPIPAVFVLDREGVIVARHVNPDYRQRADLGEVLAALRALG